MIRISANRYVGQISGGQCQRANIARALVLRPELVICDEPVSSLDYSIRKQILHLLNELQEKYEMTYLLITHDLSNVPYLCKEVAIMYQGRVVEFIDHTDSLKETAVHPYTKDLFDSIPVKDRKCEESDCRKRNIFRYHSGTGLPISEPVQKMYKYMQRAYTGIDRN